MQSTPHGIVIQEARNANTKEVKSMAKNDKNTLIIIGIAILILLWFMGCFQPYLQPADTSGSSGYHCTPGIDCCPCNTPTPTPTPTITPTPTPYDEVTPTPTPEQCTGYSEPYCYGTMVNRGYTNFAPANSSAECQAIMTRECYEAHWHPGPYYFTTPCCCVWQCVEEYLR
jgi:hypothetical protein